MKYPSRWISTHTIPLHQKLPSPWIYMLWRQAIVWTNDSLFIDACMRQSASTRIPLSGLSYELYCLHPIKMIMCNVAIVLRFVLIWYGVSLIPNNIMNKNLITLTIIRRNPVHWSCVMSYDWVMMLWPFVWFPSTQTRHVNSSNHLLDLL